MKLVITKIANTNYTKINIHQAPAKITFTHLPYQFLNISNFLYDISCRLDHPGHFAPCFTMVFSMMVMSGTYSILDSILFIYIFIKKDKNIRY